MEMVIKQGIPKNRRFEAIIWAFEHFKDVTEETYFYAIIAQETNWELSVMLVNDKDEMFGLYLFGDKQLDSLVEVPEYLELKGIEGVLLAVDKSIQGQGWGNKLKDFPKTLGFDYIWGQQLKSLNNLQDWLKRRIFITETDGVYITLEKF